MHADCCGTTKQGMACCTSHRHITYYIVQHINTHIHTQASQHNAQVKKNQSRIKTHRSITAAQHLHEFCASPCIPIANSTSHQTSLHTGVNTLSDDPTSMTVRGIHGGYPSPIDRPTPRVKEAYRETNTADQTP